MDPDELLQIGNMVPHFSLATAQGTNVRIFDFRGRKALVLIFAAGKWPALISELLSREQELKDEDAVALVVQLDCSRRVLVRPEMILEHSILAHSARRCCGAS